MSIIPININGKDYEIIKKVKIGDKTYIAYADEEKVYVNEYTLEEKDDFNEYHLEKVDNKETLDEVIKAMKL